MFFDNPKELQQIALKTSCAIFVVPPETKLNFKNALFLTPDQSKSTPVITVEQLRNFLEHTNTCETTHRFFIVNPADAMNEAAQNAFLKTIEEPHDFCHFLLITQNPHSLLATIRSRAEIYILRNTNILDQSPNASAKTLALAKRLISATPKNLPEIALEISKTKTNARGLALDATSTAIELLYKSYFKTHNPKFLAKLPPFLNLYDALSKNGHIKLHIIADLC